MADPLSGAQLYDFLLLFFLSSSYTVPFNFNIFGKAKWCSDVRKYRVRTDEEEQ